MDGLPGDGGVVFFDNFLDDGEAEASAAFFAAGDEGVKEGFGDGWGDARAVVFDGDCDVRFVFVCADVDGAVSVDGFHGIFGEIDDDAEELDFVAGERAVEIFVTGEGDVSLLSFIAEEFEGVQEERVNGCLSEDDG